MGRGGSTTTTTTTTTEAIIHHATIPLHTAEPLRRTPFNRAFAAVYACAIIALFYRHAKTLLLHSTTNFLSFSITLTLLGSDLVLAFMWSTAQALRMRPIRRKEFPENLEKVVKETSDFPGLDVFICTADPYKEPPISVVNTALSALAYDYPPEKLSVYVSDDGGSELTLFAFMEAAKFAAHWLPFCRRNGVVERSPGAFFESSCGLSSPETEEIKMMYESLVVRVEGVLERGKVGDDDIAGDKEREAFNKWSSDFTRQNHPTVIQMIKKRQEALVIWSLGKIKQQLDDHEQVLLESGKDKDIASDFMPNLIYVSREKNKTIHHHFKAGALNALLRVSAVMTNAPIVLTLDCDMNSNDPHTPRRVLCYYSDPKTRSEYAYIQFPQLFRGLNKNDIYSNEFKRLFQIQPLGFDGLMGPNHVGTGSFFSRRAFFGSPSRLVPPQIPELSPNHVVDKPIQSEEIWALAHEVAGCNYEAQTGWGCQMGFRYGSLVEDLYTGFRLQCEGWRAIFCNPERPAFLGDPLISMIDFLDQQKRWATGVLEMGFSKHSPITFGARSIGLLAGIAYSQYAFWPIWSIPILVYAFLPQLALLNGICIFPKVSEAWFLLYVFLFLGAYGQDLLDFVLAGGTFGRWWSDQRIWATRGLSCLFFGLVEFLLKSLGISAHGFHVTSKVADGEQSKRYDQGIFEFGVASPMFVPLSMAALINLVSFLWGMLAVLKGGNWEGLLLQMLVSGYALVNCWPIYEAMVFRDDRGKLPLKTTISAAILTLVLCVSASFILK